MDNSRAIKRTFLWLQVLLWTIFFLAWGLYSWNKWEQPVFGFVSTFISISFYIAAVYGNSAWLMPLYFKRTGIVRYVLLSLAYLLVLIVLRAWLERLTLLPIHKKFYNMGFPHLSLVFMTLLIAFLFGALLYVAKNYLHLLQTQEAMKARQLATELNLLKQQVQPHFLFNTLNNIYALAHAKSDHTPVAIDRLANIMRYFTEDAPRETVPLQTEIDFTNHYIALEQLRMVSPLQLDARFDTVNAELPPMLLMPFVENLFKHGVDKTRSDNAASIRLHVSDGRLAFTVSNTLHNGLNNGGGFGLANLKKRLDLLYGNRYLLQTTTANGHYEAMLQIPL